MSLVGFKARNHPQQATDANVDDRAITWADFKPLHKRFNFTIDVAASAANTRLPRFWTEKDNALTKSWAGERVWCNPPYSDIAPWVGKAWHEYRPAPVGLIVMLLPANRTEQKWWQENIEPYRDRGLMSIEFLPGRMRFLRNGATDIKPNERPPFGCCLAIWGGA